MSVLFRNFWKKSKAGIYALILGLGLLLLNTVRAWAVPPSEALLIRNLAGWIEADKEAQPEQARLAAALSKSLEVYASLKDYKAVFLKRELSGARLGDLEEIFLKFEKPFKIYMKWLNKPKKGLEVLYERGKHRGQLAVHVPGLLFGLKPVIFLDPNSPWVREGSESYDIEDAGIGSFLIDFTKAVLKASKAGQLKIKWVGSESSDGNAVDVIFDAPGPDSTFFAKRCVVFFENSTGLPTKMELFDWNLKAMGVYVYQDLKINAGNADPEFKKQINHHLYKAYLKD